MSKKLSITNWINRFENIHGNEYNYSLVTSISSKIKIPIVCKQHGIFEQLPHNHLKYGCHKCAGKSLSVEELLILMHKKHDNFYYYLEDFEKPTDSVSIICPVHGLFKKIIHYHISGSGCNKCGYEKLSSVMTMTTAQWIEKAKIVHGNLYDYSKSIYVNAKRKIDIVCIFHGVFHQNSGSHLRGVGCPNCAMSNRSAKEYAWLDHMNFDGFHNHYMTLKSGDKIIVDGFDPNTNTIYEFYGDYWHGNPRKFKATDINPHNKKMFGELYQLTLSRENKILMDGYNLITTWESEWLKKSP